MMGDDIITRLRNGCVLKPQFPHVIDETATDEVMSDAADSIEQLLELNRRALAIITDAIMHGMPITEEVAYVRNKVVGAIK